MSAYIYAVDELGFGKSEQPVLFQTKILKESTSRVTTDRTGLAFHCRQYHDPTRVHRTPEAAWTAYIANLQAEISNAENKIKTAREKIAKVTAERCKRPAQEER